MHGCKEVSQRCCIRDWLLHLSVLSPRRIRSGGERHLTGVLKLLFLPCNIHQCLWPFYETKVCFNAGHIAINRHDAAGFRSFVKQGKKLLHNGASLMIFPEGTRSIDGRLGAFKKGAFTIAKKAQVCLQFFATRWCHFSHLYNIHTSDHALL
jgi:hypothetical protein